MVNKLVTCKTCGKEMASSAKSCPHCGIKNKKPLWGKWWFWILIVIIFIGAISTGNRPDGNVSANNTNDVSIAEQAVDSAAAEKQTHNKSADAGNNAFAGDCGISVTAEMGTDIIGQPTVTVSISNISD